MNPDQLWTTQDGRVIPIRLMESAHLVNTFNRALKQNKFTQQRAAKVIFAVTQNSSLSTRQFKAMYTELQNRRLVEWDTTHRFKQSQGQTVVDKTYDQLVKTKRRETLTQLCMWAAMVDCNAIYPVGDPTLFSRNPQAVVDEVIRLSETHSDFRRVNAVFVQYRMEFA